MSGGNISVAGGYSSYVKLAMHSSLNARRRGKRNVLVLTAASNLSNTRLQLRSLDGALRHLHYMTTTAPIEVAGQCSSLGSQSLICMH